MLCIFILSSAVGQLYLTKTGMGEKGKEKGKIYTPMDRVKKSKNKNRSISGESKTNKQKKNRLCQDHEGGA